MGKIMKIAECVNEYKAYAAVDAMREISELPKENGLESMSLEEIIVEIKAARAERTQQCE